MASGIRILFVVGRGKYGSRAREQLVVFGGGGLQAGSVLLDVAGHGVKRFGQLADFRGAAHLGAFMKFSTGNGARGMHEALDRPRNSNGGEISNEQSNKSNREDEMHGLGG